VGVPPQLGIGPPSYGIYEQLLSSASLGRDTAVYALVSPGTGPVPSIILRRRAADTVAFTSTFFPNWTDVAAVDCRARILGLAAGPTTVNDLVFGTTVIPAGKYTLWTVPTPTGGTLIFNSETGQWGTDYHSDKDFARVNLTTRQVSPPVEQFVIAVAPQPSGGLLSLAWDDRQ